MTNKPSVNIKCVKNNDNYTDMLDFIGHPNPNCVTLTCNVKNMDYEVQTGSCTHPDGTHTTTLYFWNHEDIEPCIESSYDVTFTGFKPDIVKIVHCKDQVVIVFVSEVFNMKTL